MRSWCTKSTLIIAESPSEEISESCLSLILADRSSIPPANKVKLLSYIHEPLEIATTLDDLANPYNLHMKSFAVV